MESYRFPEVTTEIPIAMDCFFAKPDLHVDETAELVGHVWIERLCRHRSFDRHRNSVA
jgi:hypothetical protein